MLRRALDLFRDVSRSRRTRHRQARIRRENFFYAGRRAGLERLEAREVMDATLHNVAAANVNVVQNDTGNATTSVTVTAPLTINDFRIRAGSNRADYNVQIGPSAADDVAGGILISSITNNGRDNGESTPAAGTVHYGTPGLDGSLAAGYFVPVFDTSTSGYAGGTEYNFNFASGYFPYADGWIGGWLRNAAGTNGGVNDLLTGSPNLQLGSQVIDLGGGVTLIDLRSLGINSQTDGVLLVNGGKNEDNFALSQANADGTWTIFCHDNGVDGTSYEQDYVSFVYVPMANTSVVAGKFRGGANNISLQNAPFTVTNPSTGVYRLTITGKTPSSGVLLISAEGGAGNNIDNVVSYAVNGNSFDIQTRDLPNMGLQNIGTADPVVSFVFIPGPTPGITLKPTTGLLTTEAGGTATFQMVLDTAPTADVTIPLSSSNTAEGTVSPDSITFTSANWNVPQTVTITGQNDAVADGAVQYSIVTGAATSTDASYSGRDAADASVRNADDEAGITVSAINGLITTEAGGTATFTVRLNTAPTGDVVIGLSSSNTGEGTVSPASLTFTPANFATPQTVTITGVNDAIDDGNVLFNIITAAATSTDTAYNGLNPEDVSVSNTDNDTAGITVDIHPITVNEAGTTAQFKVVLNSQPTANVTLGVTSNDLTEGTLSAPSVIFTPANWNTPQLVTVTGVNDQLLDGNINFSVVTAATTSADPLYNGLNPNDIPVANLDNEPTITVSRGNAFYNPGAAGQIIDADATILDPLTPNYNNYQLLVTLTAGADANDRVEIRNYGTGAGQVGVSGSNVTFGGATIGTFTGGSGSTPLTISFNSTATPASAQAVLRAITFRNLLSNPPQQTRTATIIIKESGVQTSNTATRGIQVGLVHVMEFQQGVDRNYGVYTGQVDTELLEADPDTPHPIGDANGLLVDAPTTGTTETSQILIKYNSLFGNGPGQIPLGSTIVSAELLVNVNNPGDGGTLNRMLAPWNDVTDTWNTLGNGGLGRNTTGGVQLDDLEARVQQDSEWGLLGGTGGTGTGIVSIGVTRDLAAWSAGAANEGWVINGWPSRTDGTAFSPAEAADPLVRPHLKVVWLPPTVPEGSYRQGVNGYNGAADAVIRQAQPTTPASAELTLSDVAATGAEVQTLLRFDDIIGTGAGQIPPGAMVHYAVLTLASTTANATGDGGRFVPLLQTWDLGTTWDTWVGGIQANGTEAASTFTTQAGNSTLAPDVQGGFNPFDVTADVQAWVKGTTANNGWAILPWASGADDWVFGSSDISIETSRPQLRVFYTVPGVTITPSTGLVTSETGSTASFTVQLDTAPTANVTIPLSSNDTTEGNVAPTSLTFTPLNWNVPQTVTITGVDDALADGDISYSIVTGPITSTDPFYNNFNPADVTVTNSDNEVAGVTVFPLSGLVTTEAGGTSTFTMVLNLAPTANVTIGLSSSDATEGTVGPPLVFTPANWNTPQTVTVTGVNDFLIDGDIAYTVVTANATSTDARYNNLVVADVSVTNQDNDTAGVTFTPSTGLKTTEAGGTATFTAVLTAVPTANVSFDLSSSNGGEGNAAPGTLTFTPGNWNVPQTVTITGFNDNSVANDGAVPYAIITSPISSSDPNYNNVNPIDISVTNVDVRPLVTLPEGTKLYGFGGPAVLLDALATAVDLDSANLNTGTLTVQATSGGTVDDRIEIRNTGTGLGQIGVSGANVTFGGTTIGVISGGVGTAPLVVTFNTNATPAAAQALLRAVTFRNVSATFSNSNRTMQVTLLDEAGNTSGPVTKSLVVGMRRATSFQNGADLGNGAYSGTSDIELNQTTPGTAFPTGSSANGLVVVGSALTSNSQVLLRFDSIFGNGPGQIPLGAIITSAYLDLDVNTSGDGPVFRRMLTPWNANTETWNSLTNGVQTDNVEARTAIESTLNTASGGAANTGVGTLSVGVLSDLQAWSNGETNNGWAVMPFGPGNSTAFTFSPSEAAAIVDRPKLRVDWIPAGAASSGFRQGENGYTGAIDTVLAQANPTTVGATTVDLFTDYDDGAANATHVLLQFTNIIGAAANQVPAGTKVYAAVLTLPGMGGANTPGDGGSLRTVLQPWTAAATWANSFGGDGLQGDGVDLSLVETARAGNETRSPNFQAGFNMFDVTQDVQAWLDGTATNNGWGFLPWVGGSDGWAISSSETTGLANRPKLTVYYEAVTPSNLPPTIATISNVTISEDAALQTVNFSGVTAGGAESQALTVTASSSNTGLIPNPNMTYTSPGATGSLNFTPVGNQSGTSTITVTVRDAGPDGIANNTDDATMTTSFTVTVNAVNDLPTVAAISNLTLNVSAGLQTVNFSGVAAGGGESQALTVTASSSNTALIPNPAVTYSTPAATGSLSFTPVAGQSGTATITVTVRDVGLDGVANNGDDGITTTTFNVTVNANAPPTIAAITNVTINEDPGLQTVNFSGVTAGAAESQALTVTASSSNTGLIPNPVVSYTSPAATGSLTFTPVGDQSGTSTITVTVRDAGPDGIANNTDDATTTTTFTVTVNAVNDLPTIAAISNLTINEDAGLQTVNISGVAAGGGESQVLTVTASTSNTGLIPNPTVTYTSPGATGSLAFTPVANQSGTATITVTVRDVGLDGIANNGDDGTTTTTFTVTVNAVNDLPTIAAISNLTINEDAGLQTLNISGVGAGGGESQALTVTASSSNTGLIPNPVVTYTSPAATGSLTFTPVGNVSGAATITVTVRDVGLDGVANNGDDGITTTTFTVTVNSVNDAPTFTVGTAPAVNEDAPAQTLAGFMSAISAGPSDESGQTLTFNVTGNTNTSLFQAGPSISPTGTLTYTPAANANGTATITVTLSDNGGTANGGVAVSGPQSFVIAVNAVNDAPSFTKGADVTIPFNSPAQTVTGWATAISAGPTDEAAQSLTFSVTGNTNAALFSVPPAVASNGNLTFTPAAGQQGTATITLQLTDGGGTANGGVNVAGTQTFTITIDPPINLPPTINPISMVSINEDAGLQTVNLSGITAGGSEVQNLQVTVSSSNTTLIPTPVLSYISPATTGTLTFTPVANGNGSSVITVTVRDAGLDLTLGTADDGLTTRTFNVNVAAVNDPPDATDRTISTIEGTPLSSNFLATDIDSPVLTYTITMSPVLGAISGFNPTTGAFTYTPAVGATGLDLINFMVSDGTSTDSAQVRVNILPQRPVVTSTGGNINVNGTNGRDIIIVSPLTATQALVRVQNPDSGYAATGAFALTGSISVSTGAGNDRIDLTTMPNDSLLDAGADDDDVFGGVGNDTIIGGSGSDKVNANRGNNVVWGDVIGEQDLAAGGDDILSALEGNDVMYGGGGDDQLFPGAGNDFVNAGQGDDLVGAANGNDRVFGGQGNDVISGDAGDDIVSGNGGEDHLYGNSGNDLLIGGLGASPDDVNGGDGDDLLVAGELMNGFASLVGDANDLALIALLGNWNTSHAAGLLSGVTAGDDGVSDLLLGGVGNDDFYASVTDSLTDLNAQNMGVDRRFS